MVNRKDIEEEGEELETKNIRKKGGDEVGFSLENQLPFASAPNIPFSQNLQAIEGRVKDHKTDEQ
jgi:hypothetical protein